MPTMPGTRSRRVPWCALLAIGLLGSVASHAYQPPSGACDAATQEAPLDFTLKDVNGDAVSLDSYHGNVIVLSFWATWCLPCRVEVPRLVKLQRKYREKGLTVVGL